MSGLQRYSSGFHPGNQQPQRLSLNIPPPPLPPRFPPSTIIPHCSIPPPPIRPPYHPPQFSSNFSSFPTQTFQIDSLPPPTCHFGLDKSSFQNATNVDKVATDSNCQWEIDNWLRRRKTPSLADQPKKDLKIYVIREKLNTALKLIKNLENAALTLSVMVKTVTPQEWDEKCVEIEGKKNELSHLLNELNLGEEDILVLQDKLLKRSKKRARIKRQSNRWKKQKEETKIKSKNLHFQIDKWQKEMQEEVERTKREEELQREADAVLWVVTHKKTEAIRQVALLSSLQELREVRVKRLSAAGKPTSDIERQTFSTVIERLKQLWNQNLGECQLEEQMLRGMLSEAEVRQDPVKTYKKLVLQEWHTAIFGPDSSHLTREDELVEIRRCWDQFALTTPTVLATSIPPGWVLPTPPSSDQFALTTPTVLATSIPPGWVLPTPPSSDQWHTLLKY